MRFQEPEHQDTETKQRNMVQVVAFWLWYTAGFAFIVTFIICVILSLIGTTFAVVLLLVPVVILAILNRVVDSVKIDAGPGLIIIGKVCIVSAIFLGLAVIIAMFTTQHFWNIVWGILAAGGFSMIGIRLIADNKIIAAVKDEHPGNVDIPKENQE